MRKRIWLAAVSLALVPASAAAVEVPVTLRGSPESMQRQHRVATDAGYTFVRSQEHMRELVAAGDLVPVPGGPDYEVMDWVFPYALPDVRAFVERVAADYRDACGERLVVTSLTRPRSEQPSNAHALSVHPAGMAVDLRIPRNQECRQWLETALLAMEEREIVDITRELRPPHYHVAVFPEAYAAYLAPQLEQEARLAAAQSGAQPGVGEPRAREPSSWGLLLLFLAILAGGGAALGFVAWQRRREAARRE